LLLWPREKKLAINFSQNYHFPVNPIFGRQYAYFK
jgi:hypothetical protein